MNSNKCEAVVLAQFGRAIFINYKRAGSNPANIYKSYHQYKPITATKVIYEIRQEKSLHGNISINK